MECRAWMNFRLPGLRSQPMRPSRSPKRTKWLATERIVLLNQGSHCSQYCFLPPGLCHPCLPQAGPFPKLHTFYGIVERTGLKLHGEASVDTLQHLPLQVCYFFKTSRRGTGFSRSCQGEMEQAGSPGLAAAWRPAACGLHLPWAGRREKWEASAGGTVYTQHWSFQVRL